MITAPRDPDPVLCALVGKLLMSDALRWRHHKIGVLQAYVSEGDLPRDVETRIHVWHPELVLADEDSGRIHDHRFKLTSQVLLGAILDTEIGFAELGTDMPPPKGQEAYQIWAIQNARKAAESGEHWVKLASKERYVITETNHVYNMGATYSYSPRQFHRTNVEKLTVTLCTKKDQSDIPARLLARVGATPKHAFDPGPKHGELSERNQELLVEAGNRLLTMSRSPGIGWAEVWR